MKRYLNKSKQMATIRFEDGTAQFLFANQSIETNQKVRSVSSGVIERDKPKAKPSTRKKSSEKSIQEETEHKESDNINGDK